MIEIEEQRESRRAPPPTPLLRKTISSRKLSYTTPERKEREKREKRERKEREKREKRKKVSGPAGGPIVPFYIGLFY